MPPDSAGLTVVTGSAEFGFADGLEVGHAGGVRDACGATYKIKLTSWDMANAREQAIADFRAALAADPARPLPELTDA